MKKAYIKPMLSKENFSLTESVATGCENTDGITVTHNNPDQCSWSMMGAEAYFNNSDVCPNTDIDQSVVCYHGMSGSSMFAAFRS